MNNSASYVIGHLLVLLRGKREQIEQTILNDKVGDWAEYKKLVGKRLGILQSEQDIDEWLKETITEDEYDDFRRE